MDIILTGDKDFLSLEFVSLDNCAGMEWYRAESLPEGSIFLKSSV